MPINEYRCTECGFQFRRARRFGEPHPSDCSACIGQLRQVYHPFIFRMRRANWRPYSPEASVRQERHMAAQIGEDELGK